MASAAPRDGERHGSDRWTLLFLGLQRACEASNVPKQAAISYTLMASDVLCGKRTLVRRVRGLVVVGLGRRVCFSARDFSIGRASVSTAWTADNSTYRLAAALKEQKVTEYGLAGAFPPFQS